MIAKRVMLSRLVFDVLGEHRQAVVDAGLGAGDRGGIGIVLAPAWRRRPCWRLRAARPSACAGPANCGTARAAAACCRRCVTSVARTDAQQAMVNPQRQLAADPHGRAREAVERVGDAAVGRVFHRHDAELGLAAFHFFEHGGDRADRHQLGTLAEALDGGEVAEREFGAEVGDAGRRLDAAGGADHFAEDRRGPIRRRAARRCRRRADRALRASRCGSKTGCLPFCFARPICLGDFRPAVDRGENLAVDGVELAAQGGDRLLASRPSASRRSRLLSSVWP